MSGKVFVIMGTAAGTPASQVVKVAQAAVRSSLQASS
jgi:hypothetical protein